MYIHTHRHRHLREGIGSPLSFLRLSKFLSFSFNISFAFSICPISLSVNDTPIFPILQKVPSLITSFINFYLIHLLSYYFNLFVRLSFLFTFIFHTFTPLFFQNFRLFLMFRISRFSNFILLFLFFVFTPSICYNIKNPLPNIVASSI